MNNNTQYETFYHPDWCDQHLCLRVLQPDCWPLHRKHVGTVDTASGNVAVFLDQEGYECPAITITASGSTGIELNELNELRTILARASVELARVMEVAR